MHRHAFLDEPDDAVPVDKIGDPARGIALPDGIVVSAISGKRRPREALKFLCVSRSSGLTPMNILGSGL